MMEIDRSSIVLDFPPTDVFSSYIEALREGFRRGTGAVKTEEEIQEIEQDFSSYIKGLNAPVTGTFEVPTGERFKKVPGETLWLVCDDIFIGEVNFRHELNEFLQQHGGHVGYGIRPALEGQGFGTLVLRMTLSRAARMGMDKLLITCAPDNPGSEKIILKNGGVYQDTQENPYEYGPTKRFLVPTVG